MTIGIQPFMVEYEIILCSKAVSIHNVHILKAGSHWLGLNNHEVRLLNEPWLMVDGEGRQAKPFQLDWDAIDCKCEATIFSWELNLLTYLTMNSTHNTDFNPLISTHCQLSLFEGIVPTIE